MVKYGIVGALALAVLVAATWDGKKKNKDDVAKSDVKVEVPPDSAVSGDVGSSKPPSDAKFTAPPVVSSEPMKEASPPKPVEEEFLKYTVKKGDTFKSIARSFLGDEKLAEELLKANPRIIDAKHIRPGITLVFPKSKTGPQPDSASTASAPPVGDGTAGSSLKAGMKKDDKPTDVPAGDKKYVVKSGDTLYGIAARELGKGGRWPEIKKLNNLDSDSLKKGQTLDLPSK